MPSFATKLCEKRLGDCLHCWQSAAGVLSVSSVAQLMLLSLRVLSLNKHNFAMSLPKPSSRQSEFWFQQASLKNPRPLWLRSALSSRPTGLMVFPPRRVRPPECAGNLLRCAQRSNAPRTIRFGWCLGGILWQRKWSGSLLKGSALTMSAPLLSQQSRPLNRAQLLQLKSRWPKRQS